MAVHAMSLLPAALAADSWELIPDLAKVTNTTGVVFGNATEPHFGGFVPGPKLFFRKQQPPAYTGGPLPESLDWRKQGLVTGVKNQGRCGSCWAFSTIGVVEGAYAKKTGKLQSFSESELVDCDNRDMGCGGGNPSSALSYIQKNEPVKESDWGYESSKGQVGQCRSKTEVPYVKEPPSQDLHVDTRQKYNGDSVDELVLKQMLQHGPVAVVVDASNWVMYKSGVMRASQCDTSVNHAVLLVGYTPEYWIIKNSWGTSWGEDGYIRLKINDGVKEGSCGIYTEASVAYFPGSPSPPVATTTTPAPATTASPVGPTSSPDGTTQAPPDATTSPAGTTPSNDSTTASPSDTTAPADITTATPQSSSEDC